MVILAIGSRISHEKEVNLNVVRGGVCIYLLLGIFWLFLYKILVFIYVNAFSFPENISKDSLFYFSCTTLTTLGYGDILPQNAFAMRYMYRFLVGYFMVFLLSNYYVF